MAHVVDWITSSGLGQVIFGILAAVTALITAVYMTRLMVMTFWGRERFALASDDHHP